MGSFFIEYRDPVFSIIVFLSIVFVISFISYWWGRYRQKDSKKKIESFLKKISAESKTQEIKELMQSGAVSESSWIMVAELYRKSGDFEKTIEIYNELLLKGVKNNYEVLFLLAKAYFKAGFLSRSKDVFLNILKNYPRSVESLYYLLLIYENLRDYKEAFGVLEPLEELGEDISKEKTYIDFLQILNDVALTKDEKKEKMLNIYKESKNLSRMFFEFMFKNDPKTAWEMLEDDFVKDLADIFWVLPKEECNFDIILNNRFLKELYSAKGYIQEAKKSEIFEFDVLINLDEKIADIEFEYMCNKCKVTYPFGFVRCSNCHSLDEVVLEYNLVKKYIEDENEKSDSFL